MTARRGQRLEPSEEGRPGVSRRTLVANAAWMTPAVGFVGAAPAMAISCGGTAVSTTFNYTGGSQSIIIPATACPYIEYTVMGGNGGWHRAGGTQGAKITGQLTNTTGSATTLTLLVGGGGQTSTGSTTTTLAGGWGYGKGGDVPAASGQLAFPVGAGGGGSAILLGGSRVVVAGGGGGGGWGYINGGGTCNYTGTTSQGTGGNATQTGSAGGPAATVINQVSPAAEYAWSKVTAAAAGVGGVGGAGAAIDSLGRLASPTGSMWGVWAGTAGGASGAGLNGGGNGAPGTLGAVAGTNSSPNPLVGQIAEGGAGGGGYGGGGSGGVTFTGINNTAYCSLRGSASGGGGAGGSYVGGTASLTVRTYSFGLNTQAAGLPDTNGLNGSITITYYA